jgi:digeranylgeranylglycerophospholipid reductase
MSPARVRSLSHTDITAISPERTIPARADLVIIGGGPAGMSAAATAAANGYDVIVFEEHATVGDPVHCTGVLAAEAFEELGLRRDIILHELRHVCFHAPGGATLDYDTPTAEALVIDRRAFDQQLAARAQSAGARVCAGVRATDLTVTSDAASVTLADGQCITARAAVLATGANYALQRRLGMGMPRVYLQSAQREYRATRTGPVEVFFGRAVAPKGFGWVVPVHRPDGHYVRVGVMAERDVEQGFHAIVQRSAHRWGIDVSDVTPRRKMLPLSAVPRSYSDRVLVVGDAAGLVKPTTGGGIYYSIVSGRLAGQVLSTALRADKLAARDLAGYQREWRRRFTREFGAQLALRMLAHRMSDEAIDTMFQLSVAEGLMPILRRAARFNQHQGFIRELLRHPPARRVLFRSVTSII